ncbi:MAG: hypothetical protein IJ470_04325 [Clostridia bacterium]|nr:hypothetical protein [Clostridia bacterium]
MKRLRLLAIVFAAVIATFSSQGSLAYYSAVGKATNVVTSGEISLLIHEKTASGEDFPKEGVYVKPGDPVEKIVTVENICGHPFYLRVKLVDGVCDDFLSSEDCIGVDINTEYWTEKDGYYYYNDILTPGSSTEPVFSQVQMNGENIGNEYLGKNLTLTISAYAVQSENNPAENPWDAAGWPDSEVPN